MTKATASTTVVPSDRIVITPTAELVVGDRVVFWSNHALLGTVMEVSTVAVVQWDDDEYGPAELNFRTGSGHRLDVKRMKRDGEA